MAVFCSGKRSTVPSELSKPKAKNNRLAPVLVRGLARLIRGQKCFADEFGFPYHRVFSEGLEDFQGSTPEEVLRRWLTEGESGTRRLERLFEDLLKHQIALVEALDGVALEALRQIDPAVSVGRRRWPIWSWRRRHTRRRLLMRDSTLRHLTVVLPGFAHGYERARRDNDYEQGVKR